MAELRQVDAKNGKIVIESETKIKFVDIKSG